ncbi:LRR receptor-like serine/threonine-protein kinase ERL1 [Cryptomeria japonica]|uniref:LRR receptor-like serine/threonine-protein kinase ERL1 n=1 Tax=Cryptomeria japonica TaxID=3369 RepID=UPI0027D9DB4E|nr:LRR receptor-like serine/threonine-protein kinase ERL1 [Cryptomeria japonica]
MDLSYNNLNGNVPSWLWELPWLRELNLSGNHLEGHLPGYLFAKRDESYGAGYIIDLHSNNLQDTLPLLPSTVEYLDLSHNFFNGSIPPFVGISLITLILSANNLSGALSSSICSPDIQFLDLSSNKLSGSLPSSLTNCSILGVLNITNNNFSGEIPQDIGNITSLEVLHMNGNKLRGSLPSSLRYCKKLKILDLGNNKIEGHIPEWIKDLQQLRIVNLRSNKLRGLIPPEILQLQNLQILDLSKNNITGKIPEQLGVQLGVLKALISLNISRNNLTGEMHGSLGEIQELESLDLSHNLLIGSIPDSLGNLNMLGYLDLSYNNLSGRIPQVRHLDTFSVLSYVGNADLCGAPLNISCGTSAPPLQLPDEVNAEREDNTWWVVAVGLCYGLGVALVVGFLSFERERRRIPQVRHLDTFGGLSYVGNAGLCGAPLNISCGTSVPPLELPEEVEGQVEDNAWWAVAVGICYGLRVGLIVGVLSFDRERRKLYFQFLDELIRRLCERVSAR